MLRRLLLLCLCFVAFSARADVTDPLDPFDRRDNSQFDDSDKDKSADQLIDDARVLLQEEHLLDGRTKLIHALEKDPKAYRAHILLSGYYLVNVGHFRLALKYLKRGMEIFTELHGSPPYRSFIVQSEHANMLYLLSQIRLNLDDYSGALQALDDYANLYPPMDWYPGSRAWILMKLGRLQEAIKVARMGVLMGGEAGRTLNMLGILLSMNDQRQASLDVFQDAIKYELSLGREGQPATPLNNAGEVYRESFLEDKAENFFLRATSLPDGCEHILPALNLALVYIDELNFSGAKRAIDNFEACVAQYPLRNGEEHRALDHLARGRIARLTGDTESALNHFNEAAANRQWFGKIGTNEDDLRAAALASLGQAERNRAKVLERASTEGITDWLKNKYDRVEAKLKSFWYFRRARQVLIEDLSQFEDLYIRNTDCLLEYPTLGNLLKGLPTTALKSRIEALEVSDKRPEAKFHYDTYLAENMLAHGQSKAGLELIAQTLPKLRAHYDDLLLVQLLSLKLHQFTENSGEYRNLSEEIFKLNRPTIRLEAFALPVKVSTGSEAWSRVFSGTNFAVANDPAVLSEVSVSTESDGYLLKFHSPLSTPSDFSAKGATPSEAVNKLAEAVFTIRLQ